MEQNGENLKLFYLIKETMTSQNMIWKKVYPTTKVQHAPTDSVLLYEDEKGPTITAKTHGGSSLRSSTQVKIEKAQKIKGLLKMFGAYDHTNERCMYNAIKRKQKNSLSTF